MLNRDEYLTDWGPGLAIVSCLPFLMFSIIAGVRMRHRYNGLKGQRIAKINFYLMILAFLSWAGTISMFLN
jgi:hypothetical protein